ncbi:vWA domain-containing protein [Planctomicrobium piriforme]|uniref:Ca-activated chloride channel family protein n=1 Tax=Planctomicrobium piriforme TaxID=1576369 RepID=A0A1I3JWH1_9PLAN|nr:VWA domain-containing protein [Planctomicrobium piriforme]SFI64516.1 Ca-activated chloride channel family protein [Planctomicrobium piriforme]
MFAYPWLLVLLVLPVWMIHWVWTRRGGRVSLPHDYVAPSSRRSWAWAIHLAESLPAVLLAVGIIVLANPLRFGQPVDKRQLTNIEILVDVSGSMAFPMGNERRYDVAMRALNQFLEMRQGDAFGLTFFGIEALHWVPITTDVSAIRLAAPFMDPQTVPPRFGGTMIGNALLKCRDQFNNCPTGDRMALLISDGQSGDFMQNDNDVVVAEQMKEAGIKVFTIHIGEGDVPLSIRTVARITGGMAFAASDTESLKEVFKQIDAMKRMELERQNPEMQDNYFVAATVGLAAVLLSLMTAFGLRYTPW